MDGMCYSRSQSRDLKFFYMGYCAIVRSRSLDVSQIQFLSVYGPRRSRGLIFSHFDKTSFVNKGFYDMLRVRRIFLRNTACNP